MSVRSSVKVPVPLCHTGDPSLSGSRYRNLLQTYTIEERFWFLGATFRNPGFSGSPPPPKECVKEKYLLLTGKIGPIIRRLSETVQRRYVTVTDTEASASDSILEIGAI